MSVQIRIFMGFQQTREVKIQMSQSAAWREAKMTGKATLMETHYEEKDYVGQFIPSFLSYLELKKIEDEIRSQLQLYCSKLSLNDQRCYLLSQLFFL